MKNAKFSDGLFLILAVCAIVQIGLGLRSLSRSKTWEAIAAARAVNRPAAYATSSDRPA
jgi:hypothetical protein